MNIPDTIFSAGLDRAFGWMVIHSIWQAALIAVVFGFALLLLRRKPAAVRYWVANAALLSVLLAAAGTFWYYYQAPAGISADLNQPPQPHPNMGIQPGAAHLFSPAASWQLPENLPATHTFQDYFERNLPFVVVIWFLGMAAFLLHLLGNISFVYYLRRRMNFAADPYWRELLDGLVHKAGLRAEIEILESALVRSPLTIGHLKPLILFPIGAINRLPESEVEAILAHELAHILRRDYLFNILQSVIEALFYYHPAVWWLSAQVRSERECACDEQAIALTGDKLHYAKALVTMQEMAFFPLAPALAFAGQRQSQLLQRVRRLFQPPDSTFNIMEKWIATGLVVCSIIALTYGQHHTNTPESSPPKTETGAGNADVKTGLWQATFEGDTVWITFSSRSREGGTWSSSAGFQKKEISGLPVTLSEMTLQIVRPAGTMTLTGKMDGAEAYGKYTFTPDETFRGAVEQAGIPKPGDELMLHCFYANLESDYPAFLKKEGFGDIDGEKFEQLAIFQLNKPALKETRGLLADLGIAKPDLQDMIDFRIHGIDRAYVAELKKAGYGNLSAEKVKEFRIQGIDADFIKTMNQKNGKTLSADELVEARIFGLDKIDRKALETAMQGEISNDMLGAFAAQGIDEAFIRSANNLGFGQLSPEEILNVKYQGITPEFVRQCNNLGLGKLDFDNVLNIKYQGITPEFVQQCNNLGFGKLDFDQVLNVKFQGITPEFVQQCNNLGLGKLDFDNVLNVKYQGITPEFVQQCNDLGLGKLDFDEVMNVKFQGIDANFVKQCNDLGLGKLNFDDVMQAKILGITPEFVRESNQKGFKFNDLDGYIQLKMLSQRRSE